MPQPRRPYAAGLLLRVLPCLLAAAAAPAQPVSLPRAAAPLTLVDLAKPAVLAGWTGLVVSGATLEGQPAMQFTFPAYTPGANEWPAVYLRGDQGHGLAATDWSHYALLRFDVQTEATANSGLTLELRPTAGQNGWTTHYTLKPGRSTIQLVLADVRRQVDLSHLEEIVLFVSRPPAAYTVTVGNLVLLPGDRPAPVALHLAYPNYRGLILPDAARLRVQAVTALEEYDLRPDQLTLHLQATGGGRTVQAERAIGREGLATLPATALPPGPVRLTATVRGPGDQVLATAAWALRKLTPAQVSGLKVYLDENNVAVVEGKPFFPLGWYSDGNPEHMREIADSPFNCLLDYNANGKSRAQMLPYLDELHRRGLKLIYCLNDVYPAAKYYEGKSWEGVTGNARIAEAVVRSYRDHPGVLAWYLNDELPREMVPELRGYYERVREADPNHPCYIVLCQMSDLTHFPQTTDIMGVDPYPIPTSPITRVAEWAEDARAAVGGRQPVWLVPQSFAWYQYNPKGSNRRRIPTEAELKTGRPPTYEEERCMTYLALVHGARGLIYYCYYDLRFLPDYAERWKWMKSLAAEVKELAPVLVSPDEGRRARHEPASAPVHSNLRRAGGREYLLAVNAGKEPCEVTFDLRRPLPPQVTILLGRKAVSTAGEKLTLSFKPLEAYTVDLGPVAP